MARYCPVSGVRTKAGKNVSHANNRTNRRFEPNLQPFSLLSGVLGTVRLRLSTSGMRTIEKHGGIDGYLESTPRRLLDKSLWPLQKTFRSKAS